VNTIIELIDGRIKAALENVEYISVAPCKILAVNENGTAQVEMISDKRHFTVANLSGTSLVVGEEAKLAYRGYISNSTSFIIGANLHESPTPPSSPLIGIATLEEI